MPTCTVCGVSHLVLKLDANWLTMPLVGHQRIEADESGPAETLELRNAKCGSTLAKVIQEAQVAA